jgi:hypothetical protein
MVFLLRCKVPTPARFLTALKAERKPAGTPVYFVLRVGPNTGAALASGWKVENLKNVPTADLIQEDAIKYVTGENSWMAVRGQPACQAVYWGYEYVETVDIRLTAGSVAQRL